MNDKLSPLDDALRALGETAARPMEKAISLPPIFWDMVRTAWDVRPWLNGFSLKLIPTAGR